MWLVGGTATAYPFYSTSPTSMSSSADQANGYKYLSDSNIDWGQDLKDLGTYLHRNGIARVRLAYFGSDDPRMYVSHHLFPQRAGFIP